MKKIISGLLKVRFLKVFLCMMESQIKRISVPFWKRIESAVYNVYDFGDKNIQHTADLANKLVEISDKYDIKLEGADLLELGPGAFLGVGAHLKKEKLNRYYVIDNITHFEKIDEKTQSYYAQIDPTFLKGENFDSEYVQTIDYTGERIPLGDESIDIVFSNAVYEHVIDPETSIYETYRVTKKGGWGIHTIDFRDHIYGQDSLDFLKLSESRFNSLYKHAGARVNRKRISDFREHFSSAGFKIVEEKIDRKLPDSIVNAYPDLIKKYGRSDLTEAAATFIVQKI